VEQQSLASKSLVHKPLVLWDVGLGAAANTIAAILAVQKVGGSLEIHSFDRNSAALSFAVLHAEELEYPLPFRNAMAELKEHKFTQVSPHISWHFHLQDFSEHLEHKSIPSPHAVFYDPYSPSMNADMWTLDHFKKFFARLDPEIPFLLTNYTRSTSVRATLLLAGFYVGAGVSIGNKVETTIASNRLELLKAPLDQNWLKKAGVSTNSAPLRGTYTQSRISEQDLSDLKKNRQFQR
jgi:hypothetical protein